MRGGGLHGIGDMTVLHATCMLCHCHSSLAPVSLFPPKSERIETVVSCSLADGRTVLTLPFLCIVAKLSAALPPQPNSGPRLLSIISAWAGCHIPTVLGPCALGGGRLSPAFRFCHLCLKEASVHGQLGPLGWGGRVYILSFSRNAQALLHGCWLP